MARAKKNPVNYLQLKVELAGVKPMVWRRFVVPETITLNDLHYALQAVMGWEYSHLYEFVIDGRRFGDTDDPDSFSGDELEDDGVNLLEALGGLKVLTYLYDFGDGWEHQVIVEAIHPAGTYKSAKYLQGENACPPEDVGGVSGYKRFLKAIRDPKHPEHEDMLEWVGGEFDPAYVDVAEIIIELDELSL